MGRRIWFGLTVIVAAGCLGLALWQFGRRADRLAENRIAVAGRTLPVLDLAEPAREPRAERRGIARGTFDHDQELILRGRLLTGAPGVHIVTPLRLADGDSAVLVHRGFMPAADGAIPDLAIPGEPGVVTIEGIIITVPLDDDGGRPVEHRGRTTWGRLDREALRARLPYPLLDVYLLAVPDTRRRGWPRRVDPPPLDEGPHLSYALQWLGIGAAVFGFGVFFILGVGRRAATPAPPGPAVPPPPRPLA
jgi:surfeit locus 1 family protein